MHHHKGGKRNSAATVSLQCYFCLMQSLPEEASSIPRSTEAPASSVSCRWHPEGTHQLLEMGLWSSALTPVIAGLGM